MHRIISSHLKKFAEDHSVDNLPISKQFEMFSNYCIVWKYYPLRFDLDYVTTKDDDSGIDGIAYIIDGELVVTVEEAELIFNRPKKNIIVDILFIQAKSSEEFKRGDILKFGDGVVDYVSNDPKFTSRRVPASNQRNF